MEAAAPKRHPSILVVDDQRAIREVVRIALAGAGYDVEVAADGDAAMAHCATQLPSLVITDIFMDGKDGIEMIREVRSAYPSTKIIAITGGGVFGLTDATSIAQRLGVDRVFIKPFDFTEVIGAVRGLIG